MTGRDIKNISEEGQAPRNRGWSSPVLPAPALTWAGPAQPGMVLSCVARSSIDMGRPRATGDSPPRIFSRFSKIRQAPGSRGWSRVWHAPVRPARGGPAPSGMVLERESTGKGLCGRPRLRGDGPRCVWEWLPQHSQAPLARDGPVCQCRKITLSLQTPLARGWSPPYLLACCPGWAGPAPPGMVRGP